VCSQLPAPVLYQQGQDNQYLWNRSLNRPQNQTLHYGEQKNPCPNQIMIKHFSSPWPNHCADIIPALFSIQFVITLSFVILLYLDTEINMICFISKMLYNMYKSVDISNTKHIKNQIIQASSHMNYL